MTTVVEKKITWNNPSKLKFCLPPCFVSLLESKAGIVLVVSVAYDPYKS